MSTATFGFDIGKLRTLLEAGVPLKQLAKELGTSPTSVKAACDFHKLPRPAYAKGSGSRYSYGNKVAVDVKPAPVARIPLDTPELLALAATGGRYVDLEAWARANGKTLVQARAAWFKLGLPLISAKN